MILEANVTRGRDVKSNLRTSRNDTTGVGRPLLNEAPATKCHLARQEAGSCTAPSVKQPDRRGASEDYS